MIDYFEFAVIIGICLSIMYILDRIKIRKNEKIFKKANEKLAITNKLIDFSEKVNSYNGNMSKYSNIAIYLSQSNYILNTDPFISGDFEVVNLKDVSDSEVKVLNKQEFFSEYKNATKNVRNLVKEMSDILGEIYRIKHPVRYYYSKIQITFSNVKKIISLKILELLFEYIEILSKITKKKEINNKIEYKDFCTTIKLQEKKIVAA